MNLFVKCYHNNFSLISSKSTLLILIIILIRWARLHCVMLKVKLVRVTDLCRHLSQVRARVRFCCARHRWVRIRSNPESSPVLHTARAPAESTGHSTRTGHGPEPGQNRTRARSGADTSGARTVRIHEPPTPERRTQIHSKRTTHSFDTLWRVFGELYRVSSVSNMNLQMRNSTINPMFSNFQCHDPRRE